MRVVNPCKLQGHFQDVTSSRSYNVCQDEKPVHSTSVYSTTIMSKPLIKHMCIYIYMYTCIVYIYITYIWSYIYIIIIYIYAYMWSYDVYTQNSSSMHTLYECICIVIYLTHWDLRPARVQPFQLQLFPSAYRSQVCCWGRVISPFELFRKNILYMFIDVFSRLFFLILILMLIYWCLLM